jgi:hypothetical protein
MGSCRYLNWDFAIEDKIVILLMLPSTEAMLNSFREVEIEILVVGRRK